MPRKQQSSCPAPSTTLAPQRRSARSPRAASSPSNTFTKGERCQEVFFPSCTTPGWGGRCCYCAFFFIFFFCTQATAEFPPSSRFTCTAKGHAGKHGAFEVGFCHSHLCNRISRAKAAWEGGVDARAPAPAPCPAVSPQRGVCPCTCLSGHPGSCRRSCPTLALPHVLLQPGLLALLASVGGREDR